MRRVKKVLALLVVLAFALPPRFAVAQGGLTSVTLVHAIIKLYVDPDVDYAKLYNAALAELATATKNRAVSIAEGDQLSVADEEYIFEFRRETKGWSPKAVDEEDQALAGVIAVAMNDHHTFYISQKSVDEELNGRYLGVGMLTGTIVAPNGETYPYITAVFPGGSAAAFGLRPLDVILAVNGKSEQGQSGSVANMDVRSSNSVAHITILRQGKEYNVVVPLVQVQVSSAQWRRIGGCVVWVRLNKFTYEKDLPLIKQAVEEAHPCAMILDLRQNPGGDIVEAQAVGGYFLGNNSVMATTKDRKGPGTVLAVPSDESWKGPLLVLTDDRSYSASEILAGALRYYNRALLVGLPTGGELAGCAWADLPLGKACITVERIAGPSGTKVQGVGVPVDYRMSEQWKDVVLGQDWDVCWSLAYFAHPDPLFPGSGKVSNGIDLSECRP